MAVKSAHKARVYTFTGTWGSPTYSNWANARDISPSELKADMNETAPRTRDFKGYSPGRKDADISIVAPADDPADTTLETFLAAWWSGAAVGVASVSGDITAIGTEGWRGMMIVESISKPAPMDGAYYVTIKLKPDDGAQDPARVKITS